MKTKAVAIVLFCVVASYCQIGSWDTTGCRFSVNPLALFNGDSPSDFNSGDFPVFRGPRSTGAEVCTLTNMASGYGYDSSKAAIVFDGTDDYVKTDGVSYTFSNASDFTVEMRIDFNSTADYCRAFYGWLSSSAANNSFRVIYSGTTLRWGFRVAGVGYNCECTLADISDYRHIVAVKDGATLSLYIDGSEVTYTTRDSYSGGNVTYDEFAIGLFSTIATKPQDLSYINFYDVAFDSARVAQSYAACSTFYELAGTDNGDGTMTISTGSLTISSVEPDSGSHFGGDSIAVVGTGLTDTGTIVLDGDTITPYSWSEDTAWFVAPAGDTGDIDLIVCDSSGAVCDTAAFRRYFALVVDSIAPDTVRNTGGDAVTVYGTFGSTQGSVSIGGTAATVTAWANDSINITNGAAGAYGQKAVVVTDFNSYTYTSPDSCYVAQVPSIVSLSASEGSYTGGDTITVTGTLFMDSSETSAVKFGDSTTTIVPESWSATSVQVVIKAGTGTVGVSLTNADGYSDTLADAYTFAAKPTLTSITPETGNRNLTHSVSIVGTGFLATQGAGYAAIGDPDSTLTISTWSDTLITGTTRTGDAGASDVYVYNAYEDGDTITEGWTFDSVPVILSIAPGGGPTLGGTSVTIAGVDFEADQGDGTVTFGGTAATSYTSWATDTVVVVTPAKDGRVDVILTTTADLADTLAGGFNFSDNQYLIRFYDRGRPRLYRANQSLRRVYNLR